MQHWWVGGLAKGNWSRSPVHTASTLALRSLLPTLGTASCTCLYMRLMDALKALRPAGACSFERRQLARVAASWHLGLLRASPGLVCVVRTGFSVPSIPCLSRACAVLRLAVQTGNTLEGHRPVGEWIAGTHQNVHEHQQAQGESHSQGRWRD